MEAEIAGVLITGIIGVSGPLTAAIWKRNNGNSNGHCDYVDKELCDERSGHIQKDIGEIKTTVNKIFDRMEGKGHE